MKGEAATGVFGLQVTLQTPPVIQQVPVVPYDGGQQNKNTFFNKSGISKAGK